VVFCGILRVERLGVEVWFVLRLILSVLMLAVPK